VLNYCFPAKNLRYRLWQLRKEIKQSLKNSVKADKSFVEKIIRLKYETHFVAASRKIDQTLALSSNRMKHMLGIEEAARRTANLLTLTQLEQLVKHNIDAHTYVVMREQGYDFNTILKWANMPQEWVDRLEPKNSEKSNRYDFITTG